MSARRFVRRFIICALLTIALVSPTATAATGSADGGGSVDADAGPASAAAEAKAKAEAEVDEKAHPVWMLFAKVRAYAFDKYDALRDRLADGEDVEQRTEAKVGVDTDVADVEVDARVDARGHASVDHDDQPNADATTTLESKTRGVVGSASG